ncbi:D-alanyl-D-alanine carboxypeptidase [Microbacterium protaetiae]|uniref:D-alanyl-D-alanine carboxypeptidase n=1 Tax=Microbacterium protaetiae TaxID=2509458 RepID=A0A4P6ECX7_9MICO|nr:D-alanyl-D-alanine carboxypeptidase [Microbacterium protaetiae]QAY59213.1 D-alanyl-D-alanine carboxypeptidase [Microbacterium protaetiae]
MATTDSPLDEPAAESSTTSPARALGWWDATSLTAPARTVSFDVSSTANPAVAYLLAERPRRSPLRPGLIVPWALVVLVIAAYCTTMAVWPLTAVAPQVVSATVQPVTAQAASLTWPKKGAAGVGVEGLGDAVASTSDQSSIASITKVVTALMVLEKSPVTKKDQGEEFRFTYADTLEYWNYLRNNESALDVPAGGSLTEYQMLEGMLVGSASNYAARLASNWWSSDWTFATAANAWLDARGISGITITDPTGFDHGNTATPAALIDVAELAMADSTIAGIVKQKKITLPGAGEVANTNELLSDAGVVGLKTGTLDGYDLLSVKNVTIGDTTVRVVASVLNQPDSKTRWSVSRDVLAQVEAQLKASPSVPAGTTVGTVHTRWGETVPIVTAAQADVVLWNGASAKVSSTLKLGDWSAGAKAGTLSAAGPVNTTTVDATLSADLEGPGFWWRLTHPLDLLGIG